jgi:hypothetical protein
LRVSIVVAIGATGTKEDLEAFMELWRTDCEVRAKKIAVKILDSRVTILPVIETVEGDDH